MVRAIRIYQPGTYQQGESIELSPEAGQHVGIVLRMQVGESLILFCGDNREFTATISMVKKKHVVVTIDAVCLANNESPLQLHLAQAISKGDRMELVMQKAVELGVSSITPLITARCVVKLDKERWFKKIQQWQAIVIAACEQSGRNTIPLVHAPVALDVYLEQEQAPLKLVLDPEAAHNWRHCVMQQTEIALLIGPEGGLTRAEVDLACAHNFQPMSLGPRILRTETAAITVLSVLQAIRGDL